MRRFKPRLIPTLATIIAFILLVLLGGWQASRYQEKNVIETLRDARISEPPVLISSLKDVNIEANNYRMVRATGELDHEQSVVFKFRAYNSKSGYWFATPMNFPDGNLLVIQGWVPVETAPNDVPQSNAKEVTGLLYGLDRVIPDEAGRVEFATVERGAFPAWNTLDVDAVYKALGKERPDAPMLLVASESLSENEFPFATLEHVVAPYMTAEKHMGYSLTWFTLAICLLAMWLANSMGVLGSYR